MFFLSSVGKRKVRGNEKRKERKEGKDFERETWDSAAMIILYRECGEKKRRKKRRKGKEEKEKERKGY